MASHRAENVSATNRRKINGNHRLDSVEKDTTAPKARKSFERHLETQTLAVIISITVFFGSVLHENDMVPDSFFSNKHNPINQKFVKWAWGWTLCVMTPFLLLLSCARSSGQFLAALRGILRLIVLTASWYFWVEIVMFEVHEWTGKCSVESHGNSQACRRGGGRWEGFDISGHSFLLVLIILVIHEELAPLWQLHESTATGITFNTSSSRSGMDEERIPLLGFALKMLLYLLTIIVSLLQSLSVMMVIATSLYFHDMSHKILGTAIALLTWLLTYRVCFISGSRFGLPIFDLDGV